MCVLLVSLHHGGDTVVSTACRAGVASTVPQLHALHVTAMRAHGTPVQQPPYRFRAQAAQRSLVTLRAPRSAQRFWDLFPAVGARRVNHNVRFGHTRQIRVL